jgi:hypothetical protein
MASIPTLREIQHQGFDAMLLGRQSRTPNAVEGFTFNPYPYNSIESINFNAGCIVAAFPRQVPH